MSERTEEIKKSQKKYYNEKCKTNEEFVKKRNEYNNKYYQEHYKNEEWRTLRNQYYRKYLKTYLPEYNRKKREAKEKEKREKLLLEILIKDKDMERNE
jgi:hypothetical protein